MFDRVLKKVHICVQMPTLLLTVEYELEYQLIL